MAYFYDTKDQTMSSFLVVTAAAVWALYPVVMKTSLQQSQQHYAARCYIDYPLSPYVLLIITRASEGGPTDTAPRVLRCD